MNDREPDMDAIEPADRALLDELRDALEPIDLVPSPVLNAAKGVFAWSDFDAELAALVSDSRQLAGVRSTAPAIRLLAFEGSGVTIDFEVLAAEHRIVGQIAPAEPATIIVIHSGGAIELVADDFGRFSAGPIDAGPLRLSVRTGRGRVVTEVVMV